MFIFVLWLAIPIANAMHENRTRPGLAECMESTSRRIQIRALPAPYQVAFRWNSWTFSGALINTAIYGHNGRVCSSDPKNRSVFCPSYTTLIETHPPPEGWSFWMTWVGLEPGTFNGSVHDRGAPPTALPCAHSTSIGHVKETEGRDLPFTRIAP